MNKKRTSNKHAVSFEDIPGVKSAPEVISEFEIHDSKAMFKDKVLVGQALLESLIDNDAESFMDILDTFIRVNKKRVAEDARISRATVQNAFSKDGNPTLKTIAKIVHKATTMPKKPKKKIIKEPKETAKVIYQPKARC